MRKWNSERGMSLVEATIILMVLAILTAVIAPSAGDFLSDARNVKGKEDVEAIAMGLARLQRDFGKKTLAAPDALPVNIEVMVSGTATSAGLVTNAELGAQPAAKALGSGITDWPIATTAKTTVSLDAALVTNSAGGANLQFTNSALFTSGGGPRTGLGWRGPYLTGPIGLDPWGARYMANVEYMGGSDHTNKAIVLSAGTNGVIETAYTGSGSAGVDDIIYVISGSTR